MTTLGIVAAPHARAAEVGGDVLRRGGNAFDAAVAVALAIGVTQPYHSGIGGGCNITFLTAAGETGHIDARGPAPARLDRNLFLGDDGTPDYARAQAGGLAITVPSFVAGLDSLHRGRGRLAWSDVCLAVQPLAAEGYLADFMLARVYRSADTADKVAQHGRGSPFAEPILEGQHVTQPAMARTLAAIARDPRTVYEGDVGRHLVAAAQRSGGVLEPDDLAGYRPKATPLHEIRYRGWRVLAPGLPTIGALQALLALQILDRFPLDASGPGSVRHLHLVAEAVGASYDMRADFEGAAAASTLIGPVVADRLAAEIQDGRARSVQVPEAPPDESCTSHFCVADGEGNVVSQTQTVRSHFGSGVIDPETGVVLNDSVGDFSLQPGETTTQGIRYRGGYNLVAPGAEPASSQCPLIAVHPESGDIIAAGAAGGPRIVSATVQALVNQICFGLDARLAVALPRVHSHGPVTELEANQAANRGAVQGLQELGHRVEHLAQAGIAQTIRRRSGVWEGGADPRGPGGSVIVLESGDGITLRGYGHHDRETER